MKEEYIKQANELELRINALPKTMHNSKDNPLLIVWFLIIRLTDNSTKAHHADIVYELKRMSDDIAKCEEWINSKTPIMVWILTKQFLLSEWWNGMRFIK